MIRFRINRLPRWQSRYTAFVPVVLLGGTTLFSGVFLAGARSANTPDGRLVAGSSRASEPAKLSEIIRAELQSAQSPAPILSLFSQTLQRQCRDTPDHTVTLNQQEVDAFCRIAAAAKTQDTKPADRLRVDHASK